MAVLHPLKVVIDNYPEDQIEEMEAVNNPEDSGAGTRKVPFSRILYIEQDDFREIPPPKYFRLSPGREVRLRYGYFVTCTSVVKNDKGEVVEVHCTYDPATRGGNNPPDGRKVKSTIHWVSAAHAVDAEVRIYENLFSEEDPNQSAEGEDFTANLNPNSLEVLTDAKLEPSLAKPRHRRPLPVRAPGILLRRSRLHPRQAGIQPHRSPERHLGQNRKETVAKPNRHPERPTTRCHPERSSGFAKRTSYEVEGPLQRLFYKPAARHSPENQATLFPATPSTNFPRRTRVSPTRRSQNPLPRLPTPPAIRN